MNSSFSTMRRSMLATSMPRFGFATMEKTFLASDLKIVKRPVLKEKPGPDHVYAFGAIQTDYMLEIDFDLMNGGW